MEKNYMKMWSEFNTHEGIARIVDYNGHFFGCEIYPWKEDGSGVDCENKKTRNYTQGDIDWWLKEYDHNPMVFLPEMFCVRDREAGNVIQEERTMEEALATIEEFEESDREDGTYTENFYEVARWTPDGWETEV